jgi:hypothetical protein
MAHLEIVTTVPYRRPTLWNVALRQLALRRLPLED